MHDIVAVKQPTGCEDFIQVLSILILRSEINSNYIPINLRWRTSILFWDKQTTYHTFATLPTVGREWESSTNTISFKSHISSSVLSSSSSTSDRLRFRDEESAEELSTKVFHFLNFFITVNSSRHEEVITNWENAKFTSDWRWSREQVFALRNPLSCRCLNNKKPMIRWTLSSVR